MGPLIENATRSQTKLLHAEAHARTRTQTRMRTEFVLLSSVVIRHFELEVICKGRGYFLLFSFLATR